MASGNITDAWFQCTHIVLWISHLLCYCCCSRMYCMYVTTHGTISKCRRKIQLFIFPVINNWYIVPAFARPVRIAEMQYLSKSYVTYSLDVHSSPIIWSVILQIWCIQYLTANTITPWMQSTYLRLWGCPCKKLTTRPSICEAFSHSWTCWLPSWPR